MKAVLRIGIIAVALGIGILFVLGFGLLDETVLAQQARVLPKFQRDPNWPKVPNNWVFGSVSNVAVDYQDHIWVLQRPLEVPELYRANLAPPVLEFDMAGNFIQGWGGSAAVRSPGRVAGTEANQLYNTGKVGDWPENLHGIHVDPKGFVYIGGQNTFDNQIVKFTRTGQFVMQIGHRGQSKGNTDTANLGSPADVFVHPPTNELLVADGYGNRRVIVYDADTGAYKRMWGAFGNPPTDLKAGEKEAPDTDEGYAGDGPQQFVRPVHAVKVSKDNIVYVGDRGGKRAWSFTLDGKYIKFTWIDRDCHGPACSNGNTAVALAFSPDPAQEFLFVASRSRGRVHTLDRKTMTPLEFFGQWGRNLPGGHDTLHGMAADSQGNLYTAEVSDTGGWSGRVLKYVRTPALSAAR